MSTSDVKTRTENATVWFLQLGGQGVLVPGGFILTAAHCINYDGTGRMALGDHFIETIRARDGSMYKVRPAAVEPVLDIAALEELDNQMFPDEHRAFQSFCTKPTRSRFR
jgi:hypothetical protein